MRKSVHLVGYFHVLVSYLELIGMADWTATYSHVIYTIQLQSKLPPVRRWITRSVKPAGISMCRHDCLQSGYRYIESKVSFKQT
jgi:hypothetical protein